MKKLFFLLIAANGALSAVAQTTDKHNRTIPPDSSFSRWAFDVNVLGGLFNQRMTNQSVASSYPNALNLNTGNLKFANGGSFGFDGQVDFFVGKKRHFGLGAGIMYLGQFGTASLDNFHVEYQATDSKGNIYRQVVNGHQIREDVKTSNYNIPVMLKYKTRLSNRWGFTTDAGILVNLMMKNTYTTHASFDNEAIYKFSGDGGTVYDNSPIPNGDDWLITKAHYLQNNPNGNVNDYFNGLRAQGYNVGLNQTPASKTGSVSYVTGGIGFMVQPSFSYYLSDKAALNFGVYYLYQPISNNVTKGYQVTNTAGDYSSVLNNVKAGDAMSYGLNVGMRFFIGKEKDRDHDGVKDKSDRCPDVFGLVQFQGCPDTDGDGIPDDQDSCVKVPGIVKFYGCPDSDNDGIQDKEDACPYEAGLPQFKGCPDKDGDGIPDKDDLCPTIAGLSQFQGCPDTDGDGIPDYKDKCPTVAGPESNQGCPIPVEQPAPVKEETNISTPILFNINKTTVHKSSYPVLEEAAEEMKENKEAVIVVDGYTDATGTKAYNKQLSVKRAVAVKSHLRKMGVNPKRVKTVGHGEDSPAATNNTAEGRMQNRRAVMRMK